MQIKPIGELKNSLVGSLWKEHNKIALLHTSQPLSSLLSLRYVLLNLLVFIEFSIHPRNDNSHFPKEGTEILKSVESSGLRDNVGQGCSLCVLHLISHIQEASALAFFLVA